MTTVSKPADFTAMSRLSADIDLGAEGKAAGFVRVPHSVHRSAYGWIPIPVACIRHGEGPQVLVMAGNHGDEYAGQIALATLLPVLTPHPAAAFASGALFGSVFLSLVASTTAVVRHNLASAAWPRGMLIGPSPLSGHASTMSVRNPPGDSVLTRTLGAYSMA